MRGGAAGGVHIYGPTAKQSCHKRQRSLSGSDLPTVSEGPITLLRKVTRRSIHSASMTVRETKQFCLGSSLRAMNVRVELCPQPTCLLSARWNPRTLVSNVMRFQA
jgi:hypothetical protein